MKKLLLLLIIGSVITSCQKENVNTLIGVWVGPGETLEYKKTKSKKFECYERLYPCFSDNKDVIKANMEVTFPDSPDLDGFPVSVKGDVTCDIFQFKSGQYTNCDNIDKLIAEKAYYYIESNIQFPDDNTLILSTDEGWSSTYTRKQ